MSLPAVSKHLKVLERAGLISRGREAQWRPCRLEGGPLRDVAAWLENYRSFWDAKPRPPRPYLKKLQAGRPRCQPQLMHPGFPTSPSRASSTRRASWSSRSGPIPITSRNGGDRTVSRIPVCEGRCARQGGRFDVHMQAQDGTILPSVGKFLRGGAADAHRFHQQSRGWRRQQADRSGQHDHARRGRRQDQDDAARQGPAAVPEVADKLGGMEQGWSESLRAARGRRSAVRGGRD